MARPRPENDKPAFPLEEMIDRRREARGEAAGEDTLSSAEKAPAPRENTLPRDEPQNPKEIDLAESADRPPQGSRPEKDTKHRDD